jgi:S-adenosylmethionine:tRNA ribosyltransferase-isomerase
MPGMNANSDRLKTADFSFEYPENLVAQEPSSRRDASRLLVFNRTIADLIHGTFSDLPGLLVPGDRLVFNDTKVFPARLWTHKITGARIELLFVNRINELTWIVCMRNARRVRKNAILYVDKDPECEIQVIEIMDDGNRIVQLKAPKDHKSIDTLLDRFGEIPLPPYINRKPGEEDRNRYQTIYAKNRGAVAAPTAGLHFTTALLDQLALRGVDFSYVTLHVGLGTFLPVKTEDPENHPMHAEEYELSSEAADQINATKANGGRIIAVGTTVVRVLEHTSNLEGRVQSGHGTTRLKILPGYQFKIIDGMITNFHIPQSTLLMLVCAFGGSGPMLRAYQEAVRLRYRFFSYGDAMLIL